MRRLLLITALLTMPAATADAATTWIVKGGGWGHGLGMSQYGAYGQALEGRGYRKIVKHYYRGTTIGQASGSVRILLLASVGSSSFTGADRVGSKDIKPGSRYTVTRSGSRIVVRGPNKVVARSAGVLRVMGPNGRVTVNGKGIYRDVIEYRPGATGGVTAVNKVELENYIKGVVPNESPAGWPLAALKAQALAARSYAMAAGGGPIYDHVDTAASQVYGGYGSEHPATNRAVAETKGEVLRYDGKIIVAYFHSTSGGHTENNENIFTCTGCAPIPYIRGVEDPWDRTSPRHRWKYRYSASSLGSALGVGKLRSVNVTKRGVSGRIVYARFRGSGGSVRLHGWNDIRSRLSLYDAPSTFTKLSSRGSAVGAAAAGVSSRGAARVVHGRVVPAKPGKPLRVQRLTKGAWKTVARGKTARRGAYRIEVETPGTYRVIWQDDPGPSVRVR